MELDQSEERIRSIYRDLLEVYGEPETFSEDEGLRMLLSTILSQNVASSNTRQASENLFSEYESYSEIADASVEELAEVIRVAGLPRTKAERIQRTLEAVYGRAGEYSVGFLGEMEDSEAQAWLEDIKGIGPKTASILMNFQFGADVMPVDTHVQRVSKRFRLVPFSASREKTHEILNRIVPDNLKTPLHLLMIEHGRTHCKAQNPSCGETKLKKYCSYYQFVIDGDLSPEQYPPRNKNWLEA